MTSVLGLESPFRQVENATPHAEQAYVSTAIVAEPITLTENVDPISVCYSADERVDWAHSEAANTINHFISDSERDHALERLHGVVEVQREECAIDASTRSTELPLDDPGFTSLVSRGVFEIDAVENGVLSEAGISSDEPEEHELPIENSMVATPLQTTSSASQSPSTYQDSTEDARTNLSSVTLPMMPMNPGRSSFASPVASVQNAQPTAEASLATLFNTDYLHRTQAGKTGDITRAKIHFARSYQAPLIVGQSPDATGANVKKLPIEPLGQNLDKFIAANSATVEIDNPQMAQAVVWEEPLMTADKHQTNESNVRSSLISLRKQQIPLAIFLTFANGLGNYFRGIDRKAISQKSLTSIQRIKQASRLL